METSGIKPTQNIHLIERRNDQTIVYDALVLSISMDASLAGEDGQPAVEAIFVNQLNLRHAGTTDWHNALIRAGDVVHSSHKDWKEGRSCLCYEEIAVSLTEPIDFRLIAARVAHEANRILCLVLGDASQPTWEKAPGWQANSAFAGATAIMENPAMTPPQSHASWMAQKLADGWVYGPEKDTVAKTHPCIMPYEDLPPQQQMKDWMFGAVVRAVLGLPQTETAATGEERMAEIRELSTRKVEIEDELERRAASVPLTMPSMADHPIVAIEQEMPIAEAKEQFSAPPSDVEDVPAPSDPAETTEGIQANMVAAPEPEEHDAGEKAMDGKPADAETPAIDPTTAAPGEAKEMDGQPADSDPAHIVDEAHDEAIQENDQREPGAPQPDDPIPASEPAPEPVAV